MSFRKITLRRNAPPKKGVKSKQLKSYKNKLKGKSGVPVARIK